MSAATMTRPSAAVSRRSRPMPHFERAVVIQNEAGEWLCNGTQASCSLGGDEGMARAQAAALDIAALLARTSAEQRTRMVKIGRAGFNRIEDLLS